MPSQISGLAIAEITIGGILLWSGLSGQTFASVVRTISKGGIVPEDLGVPGGSGSLPVNLGPGQNQVIAQEALKYKGFPYDYGGWYTKGAWDCSSCVNWVLSRFNITLPGGVKNYDGSYHGPIVAQYQLWSGAKAIDRSSVSAGDLVLFNTQHMGIAISNTEMISAETPGPNTAVSAIENFGEGPPNFLRINPTFGGGGNTGKR